MADEEDGTTTIVDMTLYPAGTGGEIIHSIVLAGPNPAITLLAIAYPMPDGSQHLTLKCGGVVASTEQEARDQLVEYLKFILEIAEATSAEDQMKENIE